MKFNKKILKNGLVVLHEKRDIEVTTVMLGARYGSAYEGEDEKGIAHFIEHLCFKGTEKRTARQIAFELEKVGGILNAFTHEELTAYHVRLGSEHLKLAMDVIFDIFFNPVFPEKDVKKEANVICEEIKMYKDNPGLHVIMKIKELLYAKPFGMSIAGTEKNIRSMTREQLLEKHKQIYVPENSVLCVVGNNDFEDVIKLAERFCVKRKGEVHKIPKIKLKNLQEKEERKDLQQASIAIGFHFPKAGEKQRYTAEIFATILGGGMSSKLFTEVREKRGLAYAVKTDLDIGKNYSYMIIYIGTDKQKVGEVIDICLEEFKKMKNLSDKELADGKEQVIGNHDVGAEGSNETALNLIFEEVFGKAEDYYEYEKNIEKVTLDEIKGLAEAVEHASFALSP